MSITCTEKRPVTSSRARVNQGGRRHGRSRGHHVVKGTLRNITTRAIRHFNSTVGRRLTTCTNSERGPTSRGSEPPGALGSVTGVRADGRFGGRGLTRRTNFDTRIRTMTEGGTSGVVTNGSAQFGQCSSIGRPSKQRISGSPVISVIRISSLNGPVVNSRTRVGFINDDPGGLLSGLGDGGCTGCHSTSIDVIVPSSCCSMLVNSKPSNVGRRVQGLRNRLSKNQLTNGGSRTVRRRVSSLGRVGGDLQGDKLAGQRTLCTQRRPEHVITGSMTGITGGTKLRRTEGNTLVNNNISLVQGVITYVGNSVRPTRTTEGINISTNLTTTFNCIATFSNTTVGNTVRGTSDRCLHDLSEAGITTAVISAMASISGIITLCYHNRVAKTIYVRHLNRRKVKRLKKIVNITITVTTVPTSNTFVTTVINVTKDALKCTTTITMCRRLSATLRSCRLTGRRHVHIRHRYTRTIRLVHRCEHSVSESIRGCLTARSRLFGETFSTVSRTLVSGSVSKCLAKGTRVRRSLKCLPEFQARRRFSSLVTSSSGFILWKKTDW